MSVANKRGEFANRRIIRDLPRPPEVWAPE
jgi:hypothetical protein